MQHPPRRDEQEQSQGLHCAVLHEELLEQVIMIDAERELRLMGREDLGNDPLFLEQLNKLSAAMKQKALKDIAHHRFLPQTLSAEIVLCIKSVAKTMPKRLPIRDVPRTYATIVMAWVRSLCIDRKLE